MVPDKVRVVDMAGLDSGEMLHRGVKMQSQQAMIRSKGCISSSMSKSWLRQL